MKTAIIGGKLQGIEAAYLCRKAGWETILIDKNAEVPASGLSDIYRQLDINDPGLLNTVLTDAEWVIPATENTETLGILASWNRNSSIPLAYDAHAYRISSSKLESNRLFSRIGVPVPEPWPRCGFPVVAKPGDGSGSKGVCLFYDRQQLEKTFPGTLPPPGWVLQEYVAGPSYSIEVVGVPGSYHAMQVTDLEMDARYDCKRVSAPTGLSAEGITQFKNIALRIAEAIQLHGLMDVEAILHKGQLKVLEIDARLPSQTPTAVYLSTGCNMLKCLYRTVGSDSRRFSPTLLKKKGIIYEHMKVTSGRLEICGEHIMSEGGVLRLIQDFFGADEVITNHVSGREEWVATAMITGANRQEAWEKRQRFIGEIMKRFQLDTFSDPSAVPDDVS